MNTVERIVAERNFGKPSAAKRGRDPRWPYVPVIDYGPQAIGVHATRTRQLPARAFATREEAVAHAAKAIEYTRRLFAAHLADPGHRALRESVGLPAEIDLLIP